MVSPNWPHGLLACACLSIEAPSTWRKKPFLLFFKRSIAFEVIEAKVGMSLVLSAFTSQVTAGLSMLPRGEACGPFKRIGMLPSENKPSTGVFWSAFFTASSSLALVTILKPSALACSRRVLPAYLPAVAVSSNDFIPPPKTTSARVVISCSEIEPRPPLSKVPSGHFSAVALGP